MKFKIKNYLFSIILASFFSIVLAVLIFNLSSNISYANPSGNTSGWAWSENIGWVSFSCSNTDSCVSVDYGVNVDNATGLFSGYSWSENIGWINFAPAGPYPASPSYSARVDNTTNQVNGWARALAYDGGWDGWIKMSGSDYGVIRARPVGGCVLEGYAWGGDVIGWLRFQGASYGVNIFSISAVSPYFSYSPPDPVAGSPVQFTDTTQTTCGAVIRNWGWTFQDGSPGASSEQNPTVIFSGSGSKAVSLTVTDSDGNIWSITSGVGSGAPPDVQVRGRPRFREF